jgi:uncharacterized protein YndB with AHSA1/START domain
MKMIMSTETFVYVTYIATTPEKVWRALIYGELTRQYWGHANVSNWKPGADWKLVADDGKQTVHVVGKVVECVPNKRYVVTWADPSDATVSSKHSRLAVDIEIVDDMTRVCVTHDQLTQEMQKEITNGWPRVLSSLKSFLETGRPLKVWA